MKKFLQWSLLIFLVSIICFSVSACNDGGSSNKSISLNYSNLTMEVNETAWLKVISNSNEAIEWKTSNFALASVTNGTVTAKRAGTVTITAKQGSATATCTITIINATIRLNYSTVTLKVGGYIDLNVISNSNGNVTWRTSNLSVASVSAIGWVTARKAGTATITATQGSAKATCIVTVKER